MNDNSPFSFQVPDTLEPTEMQTAAFAGSLLLEQMGDLTMPSHLRPHTALLVACALIDSYCKHNEPERDPLDKAVAMLEGAMRQVRANSPRTELPIPHVSKSTDPDHA